jgi:hypothetical protein
MFSWTASPLHLLDIKCYDNRFEVRTHFTQTLFALKSAQIDSTNSPRKEEQNSTTASLNEHVKIVSWQINSPSDWCK